MDQITVANFMEQNKDFLFPNSTCSQVKLENALLNAPDGFEFYLSNFPFRKPSTVQIISVFPGSLGVDRFYLGDIGKGILKYFTFAGLGIWWIADIISAKDRCRAYNCKKLLEAVDNPTVIANMQNADSKLRNVTATAQKIAPLAKDLVKDVAKGVQDINKTNEVQF